MEFYGAFILTSQFFDVNSQEKTEMFIFIMKTAEPVWRKSGGAAPRARRKQRKNKENRPSEDGLKREEKGFV